MDLLGYLAAVVMGISLGLIGGGGSILTVPILVYLFKQDPLIATTGSLFVVGFTALVGAFLNAKKKLVDYKTGLLFAVPSFFGVFTARHFALPLIPDHIFSFAGFTLTKSLLIMGFFGIIMILASRAMIRAGSATSKLTQETNSLEPGLLAIIWQGYLIGLTTGLVGAGGGFLIIPALVLLLKLPMKTAVGTSLAIIAANSIFGFSISIGNYNFNWPLLLSIVSLGILGIAIGQFFSTRVNENLLKRGFGYFVLIIGSLVILDQLFKMA
ncbi:MAG: sulfite exporter TauE/SafE family protein [Bdellovibrio sp.]|nr:sulfite exporter TauE/SafE family protein [Bdellovibrio sp.]